MNKEFDIRKAKIIDVPTIKKLIDDHAEEGKMIRRSFAYLYENIRDFFVVQAGGNEVVGCVALHVVWEDLAEIKSLVVSSAYRGKGMGEELIQASLDEARTLKIPRVFALTAVPDFFYRMKFKVIRKKTLPHKIWADCVNCTHFPDDCQEIAVAKKIYLKRDLK